MHVCWGTAGHCTRGGSITAVPGTPSKVVILRVCMFSQRLFQIMTVIWVSLHRGKRLFCVTPYVLPPTSGWLNCPGRCRSGEVQVTLWSHLPLVEALKRERFRNHEPQLTRNTPYPSSHFRYDRPIVLHRVSGANLLNQCCDVQYEDGVFLPNVGTHKKQNRQNIAITHINCYTADWTRTNKM
jgi:hypothetical protein